MHILTKQSFRFKREGKDDVHVAPSAQPHHVPDDVENDPIFGLALKDGSIKKVELVQAMPAQATPDLEPPKLKEPKAASAVARNSKAAAKAAAKANKSGAGDPADESDTVERSEPPAGDSPANSEESANQ